MIFVQDWTLKRIEHIRASQPRNSIDLSIYSISDFIQTLSFSVFHNSLIFTVLRSRETLSIHHFISCTRTMNNAVVHYYGNKNCWRLIVQLKFLEIVTLLSLLITPIKTQISKEMMFFYVHAIQNEFHPVSIINYLSINMCV